MYIAGIDPGKRGAIVVLNSETDEGWVEKLSYDDEGFMLNRFNGRYAVVDKYAIEKIHGRGGWGATSIFQMGFYYGQLMARVVEAAKPIESFKSQDWQRLLHSKIKSKEKSKIRSLRAYQLLYPEDPMAHFSRAGAYHDGVIDAFLIASYQVLMEGLELRKWKFKTVKGDLC